MKHELDDILRAAKQAPVDVVDAQESDAFIAGVHRKVARRRQQRRMAATSCAALMLVGAVWTVSAWAPRSATLNQSIAINDADAENGSIEPVVPTRAALERELADITRATRDINERLQQLAKVDGRKKRSSRTGAGSSRVRRTVMPPDPMVQAALAAETAAQSMLYRGELLEKNGNTPTQARLAYQRVIEIFPDTAAADRARQRLLAVQKS